jgi:hypothetical protein
MAKFGAPSTLDPEKDQDDGAIEKMKHQDCKFVRPFGTQEERERRPANRHNDTKKAFFDSDEKTLSGTFVPCRQCSLDVNSGPSVSLDLIAQMIAMEASERVWHVRLSSVEFA